MRRGRRWDRALVRKTEVGRRQAYEARGGWSHSIFGMSQSAWKSARQQRMSASTNAGVAMLAQTCVIGNRGNIAVCVTPRFEGLQNASAARPPAGTPRLLRDTWRWRRLQQPVKVVPNCSISFGDCSSHADVGAKPSTPRLSRHRASSAPRLVGVLRIQSSNC